MRRRTSICRLTLLIAALTPAPSDAQHLVGSGISDSAALAFLRSLQASVRRNDAAALWQMTTGNLRIDWPDSEEHITSGDRFVARYDAIFTETIRQQILRELPESLFATSRGVVLVNYGTVVLGAWGSRVAMLVVTEPGWTGFFRRPLPKLDVNFVPTGHWRPVDISCAGDACGYVDAQDSLRWWRDGLTLAPTLVALGADTCRTPVYKTHQELGDAFVDDWKFRPHDLNLNDSLVTEVEIGCPTDWYGPHGHLLFVEDSTHIWVILPTGRFLRLTPARPERHSGP